LHSRCNGEVYRSAGSCHKLPLLLHAIAGFDL
jgi:hypothetical protein